MDTGREIDTDEDIYIDSFPRLLTYIAHSSSYRLMEG